MSRLTAGWGSRRRRVAIAVFGVLFTIGLGFVWSEPSHAAEAPMVGAVACSQLPSGMPKHSVVTDPGGHGAACDQTTPKAVKRCVTGIGGSALVGGVVGGPEGALAGAAGGAVGCEAGNVGS